MFVSSHNKKREKKEKEEKEEKRERKKREEKDLEIQNQPLCLLSFALCHQ
jgi:hypothetical protein